MGNRMNPLKKKVKKEKTDSICIESVDILKDIENFDIIFSDDESTMDDEAMILQKNKNNPWFNEDIASIVKLCRKYRRKHHKSKTKKNELKQICKELEKRKRKLIRTAKQKWTFGQKDNDNKDPSTPHPMIIPLTPEPPPIASTTSN